MYVEPTLCRFYFAGFSTQKILLTDVFLLSVYLLIAKWDLGMARAAYDSTLSNRVTNRVSNRCY